MENTGREVIKKRTQKDYSLAFKLQVVTEVEEGCLSYKQAQRKYGIMGRSTVLVWLRKHGKLDWTKRRDAMSRTDKPTPAQQIRKLEQALARAKVEKEVLEIAINIAEQELGVDIRKKYLAKLSSSVDNKGRRLELGK